MYVYLLYKWQMMEQGEICIIYIIYCELLENGHI